jgi:hypothetical protein
MAGGLLNRVKEMVGKAPVVQLDEGPKKYEGQFSGMDKQKQNAVIREETQKKMMVDIKSSGCFKPEKYDHLSKIIDRIGGYNTDPFSYDDVLFFREKAKLKLNTEESVSREMVECMSEKGLAHPHPRSIITEIYYRNYFSVSRKYKLISLREQGVKQVDVITAGDDKDCKASKSLQKVYPIDEAPALPLPRCNAPYCRCEYAAHED